MALDNWQGRDPESFGFRNILYSKAGGVATVTINRPTVLNAPNFETLNEWPSASSTSPTTTRWACWC